MPEVAELQRQKPGKAWQPPKAHLRMKEPQRKAQLRERERQRESLPTTRLNDVIEQQGQRREQLGK